MKLGDLSEDRLLRQLLPSLSLAKTVVNGPGDDCAVVNIGDRRNFLVLKTDCVVEGVHFLRGTNALAVGWKAMMRPLSDFAATSAVPEFALVTLMAPKQTEVAWVKEALSRPVPGGEALRSQHSRRRNEQHDRTDCHLDEPRWIC